MKRHVVLALLAWLTTLPAQAIDLARGQRLFNLHCATCHGVTGMAVVPNAPNFALKERLEQPDLMLMMSVKMGKNIMPPFLGLLQDPEIIDILQYIRTLR